MGGRIHEDCSQYTPSDPMMYHVLNTNTSDNEDEDDTSKDCKVMYASNISLLTLP